MLPPPKAKRAAGAAIVLGQRKPELVKVYLFAPQILGSEG